MTDSSWPGGWKVLSDSQKRSIIFWSTWNCTQCQAYGEENVGWARHELPEGGGEVYVWLGAMIIDHGTDFFRYFNRITYQSLVLTYHSGYAMNFLLLWVRCFTLKLGWQKLGMILESKVSKELKKSKNFTQTKKYLLLNSFKWKLFSEDLNDSWNWKLTSVWQLLWTCHFLKPSFPLNNEYVRNEWWLLKK